METFTEMDLNRDELLELIRKLMAGEGSSEEEEDDWMDLLVENTHCPMIVEYIFYSEQDLSPEEILDKAFAYKREPLITPPPKTSDDKIDEGIS
jgi:hypothetical protein